MKARPQSHAARPGFGWESLTESERRVADLVAQGFSNKEIGARLYMSHRTVASHLYRIFPKLDVRSRVELVRVVLEHSAVSPPHASRATAQSDAASNVSQSDMLPFL